jgi:protein-disulfide isomerase
VRKIESEAAPQLTLPVSERDHIQGNDQAPLTLVEYGDYQCPYCGAAYPVVQKIQKTLGKNLRFVFRNFPLTQAHPHAMIAAQAAEAAALQGKFWEMHDLLFEQQTFLEPDILPLWAKKIGLDVPAFEAAIEQNVMARRIKEDRQSGIRSGVNGTPTFFINGQRHDDAPDYQTLLAALEEKLHEKVR